MISLLLSLLGHIFAVRMISRRPIDIVIPAVIYAIPIALYIGALGNRLPLVADAVFWGGLVALPGCGLLALIRRDQPVAEILTPGFVLFVMSAVCLVVLTDNQHFHSWDEFSNWGIATREMLFTNQLPGANSVLSYRDYPPGTTLFQYFVARKSGGTEGSIYLAQGLLTLVGLPVLLGGLRWAEWARVLVSLFGFNLTIFLLGEGYVTAYADTVLSVAFFVSIFAYYRFALRGRDLPWLIPSLTFLPMCKVVGFVLVLCAIAVMLVDSLLSGRRGAWTKHPGNRLRSVMFAVSIATVLVGPLAFKISWAIRSDKLSFEPALPPPATAPLAVAERLFSAEADDKHKTIRSKFGRAVLFDSISRSSDSAAVPDFFQDVLGVPLFGNVLKKLRVRGLSTFLWTALGCSLLLGAAMHAEDRREATCLLVMSSLLVGAILAYLLLHLLLYMDSFPEIEGLNLASFSRYVGILVCPFFLIAFGAFLAQPRRQALTLGAAAGLVALLAVTQAPSLEGSGFWKFPGQSARFHEKFDRIRQLVGLSGKVYVIVQNSSGSEFVRYKYYLTPIQTNRTGGWSIGEPYGSRDIWTNKMTLNGWTSLLKGDGYSHVFVAKADPAFWERFGGIFDAAKREGTLYRIWTVGSEMKLVQELADIPKLGSS
jgi:hypothetical protein